MEQRGGVDVSIRRKSDLRRADIRVHVRPALPVGDVIDHKRIPVTTPVRTMVDRATELTPNRLERMVNEADKRGLIDPDSLRQALDGYAGQPGVRPLRALLDRHTFRLSDTELEVLFRPIAAQVGLPVPLTKEMVNDFEADFFWPNLGLVVKTDGWRYHRTASATRPATPSATRPTRPPGSPRCASPTTRSKHEPSHVRAILGRTAARLTG